MRKQRVELCKDGDVLYEEVNFTDRSISKGTVLDKYFIQRIIDNGIKHVTICTTDIEVEEVSLSAYMGEMDRHLKSVSHHYIPKLVSNTQVSNMLINTPVTLIHHQLNVASLVCMILSEYKNIGLSKYNEIVTGALLHDVGKTAVPDKILYSPRRLTDEEYTYIKVHAAIGFAKLYNAGFSKTVANIALYHHENYDGSGYPFGLSGSEIPEGAMITHVADSYEAICAKRCYKDAMQRESAKDILIAEKHMYDPDVLDILIEKIPTYFIGDLVQYGNTLHKVIGYSTDDINEPIFRDIVTHKQSLLSEFKKNKLIPFTDFVRVAQTEGDINIEEII